MLLFSSLNGCCYPKISVSILGAGGVGKSTALKQLALSWANEESDALRQFDFVFHVALKFVKNDQELEKIILHQHSCLKRQYANVTDIRQILTGKNSKKVLLLLDGHDEYKVGRSRSIDSAITKQSLPNCSILLTSRDTKELIKLRQYVDTEAEITGFDPKRVDEYITKYLGSAEKCQELIALSEINQLRRRHYGDIDYGIMQVPIMLHMICVLFQTKASLPKTKTGILSAIAERCPD